MLLILVICIIHIFILLSIAPIVDHAFTPLDKEESNYQILFEIVSQLLTIVIIWFFLEKYILIRINKIFNLHNSKFIDTLIQIISSLILIGLQSHLIDKLEYITHKHPLRIFKIFN